MRVEKRSGAPFFSICIPQYARTSFLLEALRSIEVQTCRDFEVCVSDDVSPDGRESEVVAALERGGYPFVYARREKNGRYDANLRSAIALARGRYAFLLGNDDALASPETLARMKADLERSGPVAAATCNFERWSGGGKVRRVRRGGTASGVEAAVAHFRDFSFVSGVVLDAASAQAEATDRWDGAEMYQTWLACRLLARGGKLLLVDRSEIREGIRVEGESVDSYAVKAVPEPARLVERPLPLGKLGALVVDALSPALDPGERARAAENVYRQILSFTYPFWIVEYRRVRSWRYAAGVCLGMRPRRLWGALGLPSATRARLTALYAFFTAAGLLTPRPLFDAGRGLLYRLAKSGRGAAA